MFDSGAMERLIGVCNKAQTPMVVKVPDAKHKYFVVTPWGAEWKDAVVDRRSHTASSLQAIAELANGWASFQETSEVWYSRAGVTVFQNRDGSHDFATLPLSFSPPLIALQSFPRTFKQQQLILELRTTFSDCTAGTGRFLDNLRTLKWVVGEDGNADRQHTKVSVGKKINAEISGTELIPETVTFDVPIFASAFRHLRGQVRIAIDVDPAAQTFTLIPLPLEIEHAIEDAESELGELVVKAVNGHREKTDDAARLVPVYFGRP